MTSKFNINAPEFIPTQPALYNNTSGLSVEDRQLINDTLASIKESINSIENMLALITKECVNVTNGVNNTSNLADEDKKELLKQICDEADIPYTDHLFNEYLSWDSVTNNKGKNRYRKMAAFICIKRNKGGNTK